MGKGGERGGSSILDLQTYLIMTVLQLDCLVEPAVLFVIEGGL